MYLFRSKIGVLLIVLFSVNLAFCQEEEVEKAPKSKSSSHNNEIGVNAALFSSFGGLDYWYYYDIDDYYGYGYYPFLFGDLNQTTLSYRHYFGSVSLGLALGGNYSTNTDRQTGGNTYTYSYSMITARIGIEKQTSLAGKWQVYYGLSVATSMYRGTTEYDYIDPFTLDYEYKTKFTTYDFGPILGFRYRFSERFSVSADASIKGTYQTLLNIQTGNNASVDKSSGFNISISPIRGIFFNYYF